VIYLLYINQKEEATMKTFQDLVVGDKLRLNTKRPWTHKDGSHYEQDITWIVEVTKMFSNRCEYKAVEVVDAKDVFPNYNPMDMQGGCSAKLFDRSPNSITITAL
jgi:hypothetical protein